MTLSSSARKLELLYARTSPRILTTCINNCPFPKWLDTYINPFPMFDMFGVPQLLFAEPMPRCLEVVLQASHTNTTVCRVFLVPNLWLVKENIWGNPRSWLVKAANFEDEVILIVPDLFTDVWRIFPLSIHTLVGERWYMEAFYYTIEWFTVLDLYLCVKILPCLRHNI